MNSWVTKVLFLAAATVGWQDPAAPPVQPSPPETHEEPAFRLDVNRVVLYASVVEGKTGFVSDLEQKDFRILEDGVEQEIIEFRRDEVPVALGLLIDNSQSMMNKKPEVLEAAKALVDTMNPQDDVFVLHFNYKMNYALGPDLAFSSDKDKLNLAVNRMWLDGKTRLYDAIYEGVKHLDKSKLTKKALVVLSDGGDNLSQTKPEAVLRAADLSGALFYGIGIYDPNDGDAKPAILRNIAKNSGGQCWFPQNAKEVRKLVEGIARDLRNQYMLVYSPKPNPNAGDFHKIQVQLSDPKRRKLNLRTRTGYYTTPVLPQ